MEKLYFLSFNHQNVTVTKQEKHFMAFTDAERQKKRREKMRAQDLSLVQVWVPKDRVVEIKSIAMRMREEG